MSELYHYGVLGMHWGVRRYQPYGSGGYTPKDKARSVYRMAKKKEPKITRDVQDSLKKAGAKSYGLFLFTRRAKITGPFMKGKYKNCLFYF